MKGLRHELVLDQLLSAATALFIERGIPATSMNAVADTVGLTRSSMYHYVADKKELLSLIAADFTTGLASSLEFLVDDRSSDAVTRLRRGLIDMATAAAVHPQRVQLLAIHLNDLPILLIAECRRAFAEIRAGLTTLVAQGVAERVFADVDPALAAISFESITAWAAAMSISGCAENEDHRENAIMQHVCNMMDSVLNVQAYQTSSTLSIERTIHRLREDVSRLELYLSSSATT